MLLQLLLFICTQKSNKPWFGLATAMHMATALCVAMALWLWLKLHHFYELDNVCTLTQVGEYRKIPAFGLKSCLGSHIEYDCSTVQ